MAFYRYIDSTIWQKTGLYENEPKLKEYIENVDYVNLKSIQYKTIELNENYE
jgi:hypothetical protein